MQARPAHKAGRSWATITRPHTRRAHPHNMRQTMTKTEIIRETVRTAFSAEPLHSMAVAHTSAPPTTAARLKSNGFSRTTWAAKKED